MPKSAKKIGILTFHCADNYGAVLQAYALQKKLAEIGCDCEIIDYKCPFIIEGYRLFSRKALKSIKSLLRYTLNFFFLLRRKQAFIKFRKSYLKLSGEVFDKTTIKQAANKYDLIIAGSDQIWNEQKSHSIDVFMLDWVTDRKKKIAYAASFGYDQIPKELFHQSQNYKEWLSSFAYISVREEQAANIVAGFSNKRPPVVLDPVMLFSENEWRRMFEVRRRTGDEYILLYTFQPGHTLRFAEYMSKKTGLPIIYINSNFRRIIDAKYKRACSPTEFVKLFLNARYIITNSFHGTALSIVFNKDFFVDMLPQPNNVNSRLEHILNIFNLGDRILKEDHNENTLEPIGFDVVNRKLEKLRCEAMQYLKIVTEKENE